MYLSFHSKVGQHVLDIVNLCFFDRFIGLSRCHIDVNVLCGFDLSTFFFFYLIENVIEHFLNCQIFTSTSSSSDSLPTMSRILSSIYFCLILDYSPSKMISCSFSEYFSCSFKWSPTVSSAPMVSMSMTAC